MQKPSVPAMDQIYLDHNATTPIDPEVVRAMDECYAAAYANPASQHETGRRARQVLEDAREGIAKILGADLAGSHPHRLIFTSGGTEANNLAIIGLCGKQPGRLVRSAIEHPSVAGPADHLAQQGRAVRQLRVTPDGVVDLNHLRQMLAEPTRLVSVMLGNNETGVLQPVKEIAEVCRHADVPLHTDAVQVVGKLPVDFRELGVDAMTVSAHKFHGPRGIGALIVRHGVALEPILFGGFQQLGLRCGTEPVALAVGMHRALQRWQAEADQRAARMAQLRIRLETLLQEGYPELVINGSHSPRLPHTTNVSFPGLDRQALLMALDLAGVACSTGSACASGSAEPSPVLVAMGCEKAVVEGSLRISLGATTTAAEVAEAAGRILRVAGDLRGSKTFRKSP